MIREEQRTHGNPPPTYFLKERKKKYPLFCSAVMILHCDHTRCTAIVHLAQKIKEYKESTKDTVYVFAFVITQS